MAIYTEMSIKMSKSCLYMFCPAGGAPALLHQVAAAPLAPPLLKRQ